MWLRVATSGRFPWQIYGCIWTPIFGFAELATRLSLPHSGLKATSDLQGLLDWLVSLVGGDEATFDDACRLGSPLHEHRLYELALSERYAPDVMIAGMITTLALIYLRFGHPSLWLKPEWEVSHMGYDGRLSLDGFVRTLRERLQSGLVTVGEFTRWIYNDYIILQHQLVATGKLPDNTFRFERDGDRLRFYVLDNALTFMDSRFDALSTTVHELGFCGGFAEAEHSPHAGRATASGLGRSMMNDLKLPERLSGPWDHALIMTYGADIPFFENALWGQFGASCRNKIILADGQRHLEACENYARSRLLRHMNQRYVVEGVFGLRAAHGKVILLTNTKAGRLLIGSGNLSLQGYASGGEQFSEYEYTAEAPEQLPAFLAVRELIEALVTRGCITGAQACRRIAHLFENTTWLFSARLEDWRPVRDNLALSFLDQLREAVGTRPVEELWTLSPFYDRDTVALQRLMETLQPRQLHLLVQPSRTSIDAIRLKGVLGQYPHRCQIHTFRKGENNPYVHAKMYLLKLEESALCLQGSPNLSQAAMLMIPPFGNLEIANLLSGRRDEFDHLLAALNIDSPVVDLDGLGLSYQSPEQATPLAPQALQLTSGEWHRDHLRLHVRGSLPETNEFELMIGPRAFRLNVLERYRGELDMQLLPEAAALLGASSASQLTLVRERQHSCFQCDLHLQSRSARSGVSPKE